MASLPMAFLQCVWVMVICCCRSDAHFFKTYIDSIVQLETNVDSLQSHNTEAGRLQVALYRVAPDSSQFPPPMALKQGHSVQLCEMLCTYRFVDILYNLQEQDALTFECPLYPKFCLSVYLPIQGLFTALLMLNLSTVLAIAGLGCTLEQSQRKH
jgi:hypothetical protein